MNSTLRPAASTRTPFALRHAAHFGRARTASVYMRPSGPRRWCFGPFKRCQPIRPTSGLGRFRRASCTPPLANHGEPPTAQGINPMRADESFISQRQAFITLIQSIVECVFPHLVDQLFLFLTIRIISDRVLAGKE